MEDPGKSLRLPAVSLVPDSVRGGVADHALAQRADPPGAPGSSRSDPAFHGVPIEEPGTGVADDRRTVRSGNARIYVLPICARWGPDWPASESLGIDSSAGSHLRSPADQIHDGSAACHRSHPHSDTFNPPQASRVVSLRDGGARVRGVFP